MDEKISQRPLVILLDQRHLILPDDSYQLRFQKLPSRLLPELLEPLVLLHLELVINKQDPEVVQLGRLALELHLQIELPGPLSPQSDDDEFLQLPWPGRLLVLNQGLEKRLILLPAQIVILKALEVVPGVLQTALVIPEPETLVNQIQPQLAEIVIYGFIQYQVIVVPVDRTH